MWFPEVPDVPADQCASGQLSVRYEDISQDGRVVLNALPQGIGRVVWRQLLNEHPSTEARMKHGIIAILSRLVIDGGGGPVSVMRMLSGRGCYQLAHTPDDAGDVSRILLNMWVDVQGIVARTQGPPPPNHGERVGVGRVFAEHVFTKLFAPPAERKVHALPFEPTVPETPWPFRPPDAALALPDGAEPLDDELRPSTVPIAFGLVHTDSNQHVNSLVYPRLFEDAALRRFAELGLSTKVLARYAEVAYRKPCFAGQTMHIAMRAFRLGERIGAVGAFVPDMGAKPHCYVHMQFEE